MTNFNFAEERENPRFRGNKKWKKVSWKTFPKPSYIALIGNLLTEESKRVATLLLSPLHPAPFIAFENLLSQLNWKEAGYQCSSQEKLLSTKSSPWVPQNTEFLDPAVNPPQPLNQTTKPKRPHTTPWFFTHIVINTLPRLSEPARTTTSKRPHRRQDDDDDGEEKKKKKIVLDREHGRTGTKTTIGQAQVEEEKPKPAGAFTSSSV